MRSLTERHVRQQICVGGVSAAYEAAKQSSKVTENLVNHRAIARQGSIDGGTGRQ